MRRRDPLKRLICGVLLLAVLGVAGGAHHHDLVGGFSQGRSDGASRVVSSHSPLSKASHWHSGKRVQDDPCLACHLHRFAMAARTHGNAPTDVGLFAPHAEPTVPALAFHLCDPTRGPPSLS
jgi:hypothetical protein